MLLVGEGVGADAVGEGQAGCVRVLDDVQVQGVPGGGDAHFQARVALLGEALEPVDAVLSNGVAEFERVLQDGEPKFDVFVQTQIGKDCK